MIVLAKHIQGPGFTLMGSMSCFIVLLFSDLGSSDSLDKLFPHVISYISKVLHFSVVPRLPGASDSYLTTCWDIFHHYFSLGRVKI